MSQEASALAFSLVFPCPSFRGVVLITQEAISSSPTNKKRGLGQSNLCTYVYVNMCVLKDVNIVDVKVRDKVTRPHALRIFEH